LVGRAQGELSRPTGRLRLTGLLLLGLVASACTAPGGPEATSEQARAKKGFDFREGKRLYGHYCGHCHGEEGEGGGRYYVTSLGHQLPDFSDRATLEDTSDAGLAESIKENRSDCVPWGETFDDMELEYVVGYIRSLGVGETPLGDAGPAPP